MDSRLRGNDEGGAVTMASEGHRLEADTPRVSSHALSRSLPPAGPGFSNGRSAARRRGPSYGVFAAPGRSVSILPKKRKNSLSGDSTIVVSSARSASR